MRPTAPLTAAALLLAAAAAALLPAADALVGYGPVNETKITDASVFPATPADRPPLWPFRNLSSASVATCKPAGKGWRLKVVHQPIPGVKAEMVNWMYRVLPYANATAADNNTYPMFLVAHPRDHAKHSCPTCANGRAPRTGDNVTYVELPLTDCAQSGAQWLCPRAPDANTGVTQQNSPSDWNTYEQTNALSRLLAFGPTSIKFGSKACNEAGACAFVVTSRHSWSYTKKTDTLKLTSEAAIGIGIPSVDERVVRGWANGLDPYTKCMRAAQHYVEEFGALGLWLPAAYNAANPPRAGGRR